MSFPSGASGTIVTWQNAVDVGGNPLYGLVEFDAGQEIQLPDADPPTSLIGSVVTEIINGVMTPVTLPDDEVYAGGFSYTVTVRPAHGDPWTGTTTAITGDTVDLSAITLSSS